MLIIAFNTGKAIKQKDIALNDDEMSLMADNGFSNGGIRKNDKSSSAA